MMLQLFYQFIVASAVFITAVCWGSSIRMLEYQDVMFYSHLCVALRYIRLCICCVWVQFIIRVT